jgi:hypothetical protein
LVCSEDGTLLGWPGLDAVRALASFHSIELKAKVGERIPITVDFPTTPGSVMLVHADLAQVQEADAAVRRDDFGSAFLLSSDEILSLRTSGRGRHAAPVEMTVVCRMRIGRLNHGGVTEVSLATTQVEADAAAIHALETVAGGLYSISPVRLASF